MKKQRIIWPVNCYKCGAPFYGSMTTNIDLIAGIQDAIRRLEELGAECECDGDLNPANQCTLCNLERLIREEVH